MPHASGFDAPIVGAGGYVLPATQHDIVIWLTGASYDVVFDLSRGVVTALSEIARLANEIVGWPYHHDLDLTGFIDGTENPSLVEATSVAIVPEAQPGAGGSILLLQQWEHDAGAWEALPVEAQESVIGRRKADSEELEPKPPTSHVARTDQDRFGRSCAATSRMARSRSTGRSSSGSVPSSRSFRRCSRAWSAGTANRPMRSRRSRDR